MSSVDKRLDERVGDCVGTHRNSATRVSLPTYDSAAIDARVIQHARGVRCCMLIVKRVWQARVDRAEQD